MSCQGDGSLDNLFLFSVRPYILAYVTRFYISLAHGIHHINTYQAGFPLILPSIITTSESVKGTVLLTGLIGA